MLEKYLTEEKTKEICCDCDGNAPKIGVDIFSEEGKKAEIERIYPSWLDEIVFPK